MRATEFITEQGVAEGQENYNGIDISMEIQKDDEYVDDEDYDNQVLYVTASSKGKELGHVLFAFDGEYLMPQDLEVEERYRGQGIAQTMYDYVKSKGYKIRRSGQQTDAGAGFWDKHKGPGQNVWEQGVAENFADGKHPGRKELDPDVYEDLDNSIIARIARQIVPTIRAKQTPEGYVYLKTADGLSLIIGCNIADGSIDINIGSQPMEATSSGPHKSAITEIIQAVYAAAVKQYGIPGQPGTLSVDHDAGHGVWQHIAQKLGLQYDSHMVKENFADGKGPGRPGDSVRHGIPKHATMAELEKASHAKGRKGQLARWQLNMRRGHKK
jgi:GNAT superfamily N-acetyltransferase